MNKHIRTYINSWWLPILSYIGILIFYVIGLRNGSRLIFKVFPFVTTILGFALSVSIFKILFSRKWYTVIVQLLIGLLSTLVFIVMFNPRNLLFSNLDIPEDIECTKPIEMNSKTNIDSLLNLNEYNKKLFLVSCGQLGMYKVFTKLKIKEDGQIYLKAYEDVGNIQLSAAKLRARTKTNIFKDQIIDYTPEFTIYEGAWESYYVGRIELWFIPSSGKEYKLNEELFLIEGWIR